MNKFIGFFLILGISTIQHAYATCSDEWLDCRRAARSTKSACTSNCGADAACRIDCTNNFNSEYQDCETSKRECKGTDEPKRGSSSDYQAPQQSIASACWTNYGSCPMFQPINVGSSCYCLTGAGQIWGVAK